MDGYAAEKKKKLWNTIARMNELHQLFVKDPARDFTRRYKLPMDRMLKILISMQAKSLPHELGEYFEYEPDMPTASAFIQQRRKLAPYALPVLFAALNEAHTPGKMPNGYQLVACDGSDVYFAGNPTQENCYFEAEDEKGYCLAHLNVLQDVIGGTCLDAVVQDRRCQNEISAMLTMIERLKWDSRTIFTADRGYECYKLMAHIQELRQYYVLRVKSASSCGILSRFGLPSNMEFDLPVTVVLTRKQTNEAKALMANDPKRIRFVEKDDPFDLCDLHSRPYYELSFRAVCIRLSNGSFEYLVTNLSESEFSPAALKEIYHLRWGVETAFRQLKYTIGMNAFHTKKAEFIRQQIFARLILFNFCQLIALHAAIFRKSKDGARYYKLNFSMVIGACRILLKSTEDDPPDMIATISRFLVSVRPDIHFERNKKPRKPVDAFYRVA